MKVLLDGVEYFADDIRIVAEELIIDIGNGQEAEDGRLLICINQDGVYHEVFDDFTEKMLGQQFITHQESVDNLAEDYNGNV